MPPLLSFFIDKKSEPMNDDELFKNSIGIAVHLARTNEFDEYKSGFSAFDKWIDELKKYIASEKPFEKGVVNPTIFNYLADSRNAALKYLSSMKDKMKRSNLIIAN